MPWKYYCENCDAQMQPNKRLKGDRCSICGNELKPKYVCDSCGHVMVPKKGSKSFRCPECGETISAEEVEPSSYDRVTMDGEKLTVEVEEGETTTLDDIEEISLNFLGFELGRVRNPDHAEFSTVEDYERTEVTQRE